MKLVSIKLGKGDWYQGIPTIQIQLWLNPHLLPIQFFASLPPNPTLASLYSHWQTLYKHLIKLNLPRGLPPEDIEFEEEDLSHISTQDFEEASTKLKLEFNCWLDSPSFASTEAKIRSHLDVHEEINLILETDNDEFRSFPWIIWDFFDDYPQAEIAISNLEYNRPILTKRNPRRYVKILAIIGDSRGIDVEEDKELLEKIPWAKIRFLIQPSRRELEENLWEKGWDIIFFAGHSRRGNQEENYKGYLAINIHEYISVFQLKNALKRAIQLGLKMAIFNSCDGLGLAKQLAELNLPQIIVMRFEVPDVVAQEFLKHFLSGYSRGKSFYLAVREARERLEGLEDKFPAATWLPVICQNPSCLPLSWFDLFETTTTLPNPYPNPPLHTLIPTPGFHKTKLIHLTTGLLVSILVFALKSLGYLQAIELKTLDWLQKHKPPSPPDSRLLIVGIDEEDIRRYGYPIADKTLLLLLQRLQSYHPTAIGIDIFRDQPTHSPQEYHDLVSFIANNPNIVTVCNRGNGLHKSVSQPKKITMEQTGYADLYNDSDISGDYTIRRYLLSRSQNPIETPNYCQTNYSLAWHLIYRHLSHQLLPVSVTGDSWQFGNVIIPPLKPGGGYQRFDARGNQILINYRNTPQISQQLTLRDILEATDYLNPHWLENKIILVGMVADSIPDIHDTPLGKMRGIYIHAHVISQILDAVETDGKNLIWWLPAWGDFLVILFSTTTGLFFLRFPFPRKIPLPFAIILFLLILYLCCLLAFRFYLWLPLIPAGGGFFLSATIVTLLDSQSKS